jgi:hypothetical protein
VPQRERNWMDVVGALVGEVRQGTEHRQADKGNANQNHAEVAILPQLEW